MSFLCGRHLQIVDWLLPFYTPAFRLSSGGSRIGEGEVLSGMGALARREFLKTTPTFGQNLAYSALNSFSLLSLAS